MTDTVIDKTAYEALKEMTGADFLPVLIDTYFEDTPRQFEEMEAALAAGDGARFSRAAHTLKGNSANFGATRLAELSRELEFLGKSGSLEGAEPKLEALQAEYAQVKQALEALRDGL